jgi:hypothetical protein
MGYRKQRELHRLERFLVQAAPVIGRELLWLYMLLPRREKPAALDETGPYTDAPWQYSRRKRAVYDASGCAMRCAGGPASTTCPPASPPSGPRSIM